MTVDGRVCRTSKTVDDGDLQMTSIVTVIAYLFRRRRQLYLGIVVIVIVVEMPVVTPLVSSPFPRAMLTWISTPTLHDGDLQVTSIVTVISYLFHRRRLLYLGIVVIVIVAEMHVVTSLVPHPLLWVMLTWISTPSLYDGDLHVTSIVTVIAYLLMLSSPFASSH